MPALGSVLGWDYHSQCHLCRGLWWVKHRLMPRLPRPSVMTLRRRIMERQRSLSNLHHSIMVLVPATIAIRILITETTGGITADTDGMTGIGGNTAEQA